MNKEAFEQLLRVLRAVKPEEFDMELWSCGTVACAGGHAMYDPWFIERGFHAVKHGSRFEPSFAGHVGFAAIDNFFRIECRDTRFIFSSDSYSYPRGQHCLSSVMARIENFVKNGGRG